TVREDHRTQHRGDPPDSGEVQVVPEPLHDHGAGDHHRYGERQAQPEPVGEHLRAVPGVLVVPAMALVVPGGLVRVGVVIVAGRESTGRRTGTGGPRAVVRRGGVPKLVRGGMARARFHAPDRTPWGY